MRELDVRGLHCPLPILRTKLALKEMTEGEELVVYATDPASEIDFRHFCNTTSHDLVDFTKSDGQFAYRIRRGAD